ncbi:hypothetical protein S7711_10305 [Stachybotrys chartarum IBT 7711]|uniref:Enoyl reductase (ER) domain-containing protein n=1 Tax=Stachybotrys chartarum (strain CBS 109288 / IBT 7711) TaxID=1280523 RepID=A0A084B1Y5_STACB|nr:hypothetical protein S7711_10305 [Stachybotrys chartarum IBT 7711]
MSHLPPTQLAVAISGKRQPLIEVSSPVFPPEVGEVVIRVHWAASTPIDLHRVDGGLLNDFYPCLSGSGGASGTVAAVGPGGDLKGLEVGDRVTAFAFRRSEREANHQQYITVPAFLVSRVPESITLHAAVTVNDSLVTVFHTVTADLGLDLPWPLPQGWEPPQANSPILIWGASSTVGIYALQVLRHWGYRSLLAVSSARHHHHLRSLGAAACFDYTQSDVVENILHHVAGRPVPQVPYIVDCIGSVENTLRPLTKIAQKGAIVAAMMPFIVRDATDDLEPEYEVDKTKILPSSWAEGVEFQAVSTYTYLKVCSNLYD